jgi:hypothetical protein
MSNITEARAAMREYLADMAALKPFADQDQKNELNQAFTVARAEAKKAAVAYIAAVKEG